jgi:hypothetical protein
MTDMLSLLRGAMGRPSPADAAAGNNGSGQAQAQQEHDQAVEHYRTVSKSTNDKKQLDDAHDRLMKATEALGKFH